MNITVKFTNSNRNFINVTGAKTLDEAVEAADLFLGDYDMCVKNGGSFYGDTTEVENIIIFNVG